MGIKYYDCIHCGNKPYPVCPECNGYWTGRIHPNSKSVCNNCNYEPTKEQQAEISKAWVNYKEQQKEQKGVITKESLQKDAVARYEKLNKVLMSGIGTGTGADLLGLTKAVAIAKHDVEQFLK